MASFQAICSYCGRSTNWYNTPVEAVKTLTDNKCENSPSGKCVSLPPVEKK